MEDKELQALFNAKRTVEANRRRQEELRKLMAASAAPKSHRLWPVWALSAAASIALLLITMPLLFRSETVAPLLVAETTEIPTPKENPNTNITSTISKTRIIRTPRISRTSRSTATPDAPLLLAEADEPQPEPVLTVESKPVETNEPEETTDTPTIHRRTSTRLANSGNIVTIQTEPSGFQNLLASVFASEPSTDITLKTIEF